ncbi:hypothetical protein SNEBB_002000 [Seison nebaliae]|nr:hypothetical protein SNEBB_002000 [Seison nebaliae]
MGTSISKVQSNEHNCSTKECVSTKYFRLTTLCMGIGILMMIICEILISMNDQSYKTQPGVVSTSLLGVFFILIIIYNFIVHPMIVWLFFPLGLNAVGWTIAVLIVNSVAVSKDEKFARYENIVLI